MSVSSMVHRSAGGSPTVRNAVSDDALSEPSADDVPDAVEDAAERPARDPNGTATAGQTKELPDCKVRRNYTCSACDFFTQNPRQFLYHLRDVHREKIRVYECPNCLYASKHFQKLLRHSKMVHGTSEGMSAAETSRKSRKRSLDAEEEDEVPVEEAPRDSVDDQVPEEPAAGEEEEQPPAEDDPTFKCSVCVFSSRNRSLLNRHEREEHIKTKFFRCSKCTYVTHIKARYTKHVKYHSMPMIKCEMCDFRTPYKWNLDRHCKNHNGRGAFRCSACNFTADIKQSLTVHEMNHHVPPVGQAAGLGVGRRRNKVGASDTTAAEENAANSQDPSLVVPQPEPVPYADQLSHDDQPGPKPKPKIKITPKKTKVLPAKLSDRTNSRHSDFIHPDDIIHHANGNVYIKNKCKLCNFKTAWDSEMAKHERKFHNLHGEIIERGASRKNPRPIPNLIPIPAASSGRHRLPNFRSADIPEPKELAMSEKDMNDICRRSANSALKDLASLFGSEDVFKHAAIPKVPDLIPVFSAQQNKTKTAKNASFFDKFGPELGSRSNLICNLCGYESKCLTEQVKHQKSCGKETSKVPNVIPVHNISASRCQYCRHRCKSSADLHVHLRTCAEALRMFSYETKQEDDTLSEHENELKIDEDRQSVDGEYDTKPHPMENKVFVWNNITVPMDIEVDDSSYEYTEDKNDDNISLDLSMWSQSPACSDNSSAGQENNNNLNTNNNISAGIHHSPVPTTEKIPTHGNDISVAQHKRVFKCPHCTFWASTASRFHVHIVGHLNKKPFECSLCSYRSNWRWDITKHIKLKSVRDQAHEQASVLMTDETGRRNYSKYNKYLTEIPLSSLQSSSETSGGSGTRPKHYDRNSSPSTSKTDKTKAISAGDLNSLLKVGVLKPPPPLKSVEQILLDAVCMDKKKTNADSKRTLFRCKKCNFRDASRDVLLQHVKAHYQQLDSPEYQYQQTVAAAQVTVTSSLLTNAAAVSSGSSRFTSQDLSLRGTSPDRDEASVNNSNVTKGGTATLAPFRCGHCNQVSNWKHVIQRHCRLKHNGDIRVVSSKNGQEKMEIEEQTDEPDYNDVPQLGAYKCKMCPYSTDDSDEHQAHQPGHKPNGDNNVKCFFCKFWVAQEGDLLDHLRLHGVSDPQEFLRNNASDPEGKKFKCTLCPYVTNTKSQYNYHKQFHKNRGGQYTCSQCSYNVSKRHLLHQHLKIHGINVSPSKQNGEGIDFDDVEIEEVSFINSTLNTSDCADIPLVWVSKDGHFSKMFKCRFCPHVNLRKVNIQEHEKMHSPRDKSSNSSSSKLNDMEHRCVECNYICKNAGVLSSHSKVHQGLYGTIHSIVDPTRSDEEQLREISRDISNASEGIDTSEFLQVEMEEPEAASDGVLYFCSDCPARFLNKTEHKIHRGFHHGSSQKYKCDSCSYSSDNDSYLTSHKKVHTSEYHLRTEKLKEFNAVSLDHPEPELRELVLSNGDSAWEVVYKSEIERKNNILASFLSMPLKSSQQNVPISGTDLFQRRSEARQVLECIEREELPDETDVTPNVPVDVSVQGNPEFVYQKCMKNGRVKEKRYKCHKCPSAFEKREQYKIHLGLHGSRQRHSCEYCDYSVKYFANYVQHLKKHKFNEDAQAAMKKSLDAMDDTDEADESMEVVSDPAPDNCDDGSLKLSVADQQMLNIMEQRKSNSNSPVDDKKTYYCSHCPYVNGRRDALDNHLKRHECVSKIKSAYACEYCDYSVPQAHFLRDHTKLHFIPNKSNHVDGYMICDNFKLTSSKLKASNVKGDDEELVIYENDAKDDPPTGVNGEKFNNNKGETELPDVQTGDLIVEKSSEPNS
ncbi:uncharacterized protein LOC143201994 isoform X2 [Rhynchophorus ferrugineus]